MQIVLIEHYWNESSNTWWKKV